MEFNQSYYDNIWGTIHRHDYCESLANRLIQLYGSCRILDIGTGCGELVRVLREKGCDAFGLEMSNYAIENSCCKEYVRKGDIRDIPFASQRFDVVHSQGVWGYFSEIDAAWNECKRVGRIQHHNIDYNDTIPEHKYLITESEGWWKNQFYEKILVACPTHECKDYVMQRWIDNVKLFTYPNYEIFVVDNSPDAEMTYKYSKQIKMSTLFKPNKDHSMLRINQSMEVIRQYFLSNNYSRWFNCEIDIIPPNSIIEQMLRLGCDTDWISHSYPMRGQNDDAQQGIGCSIFTRKLIDNFNFNKASDNSPDGWLWNKIRPDGRFTTMELWNYFHVEHIEK